MRFKYLFLFYFNNIRRNKLYLITSIGFILVLSIRILMHMNTWFDQENYSDLLAEIVLVVQMVSILYMIYFYNSFSNELKFGVHNFFVDGYKILLEKITALLFVHFLFQAFLLSIVYIIFFILYLFVGVEWSSIYLSVFRYLTDYMFFPLLLTALIGIIFALIFGRHKISIIFILLTWFFTGGINQEVFASFFKGVGSTDWETLLSIGPNSIYTVYKSYMGFNTNIGLELRILSWLLLLLLLLLVVSTKWAIIKRERHKAWVIVLALLLFSFGTGYLSIQYNTSTFNLSDHSYEIEKYRHMKETEVDLNYNIESYRIILEGNQIDAEIELKDMNTKNPSFQLYHGFPIEKIIIDGEDVSYYREGDIVHIESPTEHFTKINFNYELKDTGLIYSEKGGTILLADQAWYPKKREEHIYTANEDGDIDVTDDFLKVNERYHFKLFAEGILFTNLQSVDNHFEGEVSGVSIVKGQGNQLDYKGYEVTYPADWPDMSSRTEEVISRLEIIFEEVNQIVHTDFNELPSKILYLTDGRSAFLHKDHLVYNTSGITTAITDPETLSAFDENLIKIMVEPKGPTLMFDEWVNITSLMIKGEYDFPVFFQSPVIDILGTSSEERVNAIHAEFGLWDIDKKRSFLKEWYQEMDETWTWDDVEALMEARKTQ
ncbi:ABC transporter permease [Oceanobacillus sp. J11TS1]|uniref:ABC transporter permease n=1 Tax=Oceanobacillus sp. J11TS1 TaxID=2807191 RepID=UPI001B04BDAB|nr:ABC transporter permease [Oceanobacillus sp. J11TS1]GIO22090.1 hypothetical protein J11TS1_06710 [Oceanobacillus sp. J11TS1]